MIGMMAEEHENLRRSSRLKTRINLSENEDKPQTSSKNPRGRGSRGRTRKNSNSSDIQPTIPSTRNTRGNAKPRENSDPNSQDEPPAGSLMGKLEKELESIEEEVHKPSELFNDEDVSGNRIYGFHTPIKKNAMAEKALLSRTPTVSKTPTIPKKKPELRVLIEKADVNPSISNSQLGKSSRAPNAPVTRKRQVHFSSESESVSEDSEFVPSGSGSEQETEEGEDSNVENEDSEAGTLQKPFRGPEMKKVQIPITPCRRGRSKNSIAYRDYHLKTDEYFETQAEKPLTSNHTLGRLKNPRLNEGKLQELLKNQDHTSESHREGIHTLTKNYKSNFPMWYHIMEEGYSLLLHGLGSKRNLINDFHKEIIANHPTLIINGFFPSLTIKDILDEIITELLELDCPGNPNDCFNMIEDVLMKNPEDRLYLLIHNIDGSMLRSNRAQDILSRLTAIPNVRLMASVDHINAPLIWDNVKRSRYNFYWWDATTLLPYEAETSYESSLLVQRSGALALSSLHNIFASLTTNAKAIYIILVKYQLENGNNHLYSGMAFKDLYRGAREGFLVSSDIALRTQLTEFIDHKLVRTKRNVDGAEYLIIPLDNSLLQKFLEDQETRN